MNTVSKQKTIDTQSEQDRNLDYYELAVYFAAVKARDEEFRWEQFIDNLSYFCDQFATHIEVNDRVNR
ncbi:hypothetical protein JT359_06430 [Candidatus Poribacteria bacterium]|nr:hypothetical protein [Candidatus Poribacteria bacterium]